MFLTLYPLNRQASSSLPPSLEEWADFRIEDSFTFMLRQEMKYLALVYLGCVQALSNWVKVSSLLVIGQTGVCVLGEGGGAGSPSPPVSSLIFIYAA